MISYAMLCPHHFIVMKKIILTTLLQLCFYAGWSQTLSNTVKGKILDAQSGSALPGANIILMGSEPLVGTQSDPEGIFRLPLVPLGRQTLKVTSIGYCEQIVPNVLVTAGKEVNLEIRLVEQVINAEEITVKAGRNQDVLNNEFGTLSARTFDVENTRRFAGSRNDPARMAANFAGVVGNNDARNDIVIRGNSPTGLLWRLEGIDIPNPSHYGALGATGGPVTILNNNVLSQSDFFTGAFPATYGNALSGVFDLQLKTGNRDKREYTGQVGFNGFELGAEGPFKKGKKATYLAHYRYSVMGLVQKLGISMGTGSSVPNYQDLSFKIDIPTKKAGSRWSMYGVGGTSDISFKGDLKDTANLYSDPYNNLVNKAKMGVAGVSYLHYFNEKTFLKTSLAVSGSVFETQIDSLNDERQPFNRYRDKSSLGRITFSSIYNKKLNAKNLFSGGVYFHRLSYDLLDSTYSNKIYRRLRDENGGTELFQVYGQWQYKPLNELTINGGLHFTYFNLNKKNAVEPRLGIRYDLPSRQAISFAAGMNSQIQPIQLYFYKTRNADGSFTQTNMDLDLTKSYQFVGGYERYFGDNVKLKTEVYYQHLYDVPVEKFPSTISVLNLGATFSAPDVDSLVNDGEGQNYGLEITLERNFNKGYYFLTTVSLYESRYQGSDKIWRNTAFNGRYVANVLGGKEWKFNEKHSVAIDFKVALAGGRPHVPVNLQKSIETGWEITDKSRSYENRYKSYFRTDLKLTYRQNGKRMAQEWFLDIQNVSNTKNIFSKSFDVRTGKIKTMYQTGLYPNFNYRIEF